MLKVMRKPEIFILWISQLMSAMGDHLFYIAITWTAIKTSGSSAALVIGAGTLSALLFGLFGGVYADRFDKRFTLVAADLLRASIIGLLPIIDATVGIHLWHLVAAIVLVEILGTLFSPSLHAAMPELCGTADTLQATNALMESTQRFARVFAPGLTGLLLVAFSLNDFFNLDAVSFLVSAAAILVLKRAFSKTKLARKSTRKSPFYDLADAFRLLKTHRILTWSLISLGLVNLFWAAAFMIGVPLFTEKILREGPGAYGLIGSAYGIGNIVSLFIAGSSRRNIVVMYIGHLILAAGFALLAWSHSLALALTGAAIAAFGSPLGDLIMVTMIQTDFPRGHIGKIYSMRALIGGIGVSLGTLAAAPLFQWLSVQSGILACALGIAGIGMIGIVRFTYGEKPDLKEPLHKKGIGHSP